MRSVITAAAVVVALGASACGSPNSTVAVRPTPARVTRPTTDHHAGGLAPHPTATTKPATEVLTHITPPQPTPSPKPAVAPNRTAPTSTTLTTAPIATAPTGTPPPVANTAGGTKHRPAQLSPAQVAALRGLARQACLSLAASNDARAINANQTWYQRQLANLATRKNKKVRNALALNLALEEQQTQSVMSSQYSIDVANCYVDYG